MSWKDEKHTLAWHLRYLDSTIAYEDHKGIHTYHTCPFCKKNATRTGKCSTCIRKVKDAVLKALDEKDHSVMTTSEMTWWWFLKALGVEEESCEKTNGKQ